MLSLLVALGGVSLVFLVVVLVVVPPDMTLLADCIMVAQMGSRSVTVVISISVAFQKLLSHEVLRLPDAFR